MNINILSCTKIPTAPARPAGELPTRWNWHLYAKPRRFEAPKVKEWVDKLPVNILPSGYLT